MSIIYDVKIHLVPTENIPKVNQNQLNIYATWDK